MALDRPVNRYGNAQDKRIIIAAVKAYGTVPPSIKMDDHVQRLVDAINAVIALERLDDLSL